MRGDDDRWRIHGYNGANFMDEIRDDEVITMTEQQTHRPISSWGDLFMRTVELGLGAASLTMETAQKVVADLVHRGQVTEEEGETLVDRLLSMGREQRAQLEQLVNKGVEHTLERMDLARRSDVEALREHVQELETIIRSQTPTATPPSSEIEGEITDHE
jgi:polyhydroxyalkanoate synthesis regulator phasin